MAELVVTTGVPFLVEKIVQFGLTKVYNCYKKKVASQKDGVVAVQQGLSQLDVGVSQVGQGVDHLRSDIKAVRQDIQKALDNQASLVALFAQGADEICARLDVLQLQFDKGFKAVSKTVKDEAALRDAREFKTKLGAVTMAYDLITDDIIEAAKSKSRALPKCTSEDAKTAKAAANDLYLWAGTFVPDNAESAHGATRQEKLQMMPYIVAMAYAARVKVVTQFLERDMASEDQDKAIHLNRARRTVDEFIDVLAGALDGLMADTSLLEIALVYQLPLATYLTLMASFRSIVDDLLAHNAKDKDVAVWDDGLSLIRSALRWNPGNDDPQDQTIQLESVQDSTWWLTFTDTNLKSARISAMRTSIHVRELCHVLGAVDDNQAAHIALNPGQESALTHLPPASEMRTVLCANIAHARNAPPPQSFARITKPPPPCQAMRIQAAADPRTLTGHTEPVYGVAVCPDGQRVVSGSSDKTARVWSLNSGQHLRTFSGHTDLVYAVAVSPDGKRAVSSSWDASMRVWSVDSGSAQHTLKGHSSLVFAVAVSPDGRSIASGSADTTVRLWDVYTGQCHATLTGHSDFVLCVAFSPDGQTLVSGSKDKSIKVWNARTGALQRTLNGHSNIINGVAVTPDGQWLVSGSSDETVKVWRLSSGAEEMAFTEHTAAVNCVAVFPDGQRIASGSGDKTVRVWNLRSRKLELTLTGHSEAVMSVAVSPDGRSVVSGSNDTTIKVWALSD